MTVVRRSADCGNSPKNAFVQNVAISLASGEFSPDIFSEEVVWCGADEATIEGKAALAKWLSQRKKPTEIEIAHAISHGKVGAANGTAILADGHKRRFSLVFQFTNSKANAVARIDSYV